MSIYGDSRGVSVTTHTARGARGRYGAKTIALAISVAGALFLMLAALGCGSDTQSGITQSDTSAAAVDTGGRLQLNETYFDAGNVPVDQKVEHNFSIKNTGTGPLNLGQMAVKRLEGCWDAQAVVGSTTLAPGESTDVTVSMLMHKGMGGQHLFEVTVNSNDPAPAASKVSLRANYI